jgi:hypothetical protein
MHQYRSTSTGRRRFAAVGLAAAMTVSGLVIATAPPATATSVAATAAQALSWGAVCRHPGDAGRTGERMREVDRAAGLGQPR